MLGDLMRAHALPPTNACRQTTLRVRHPFAHRRCSRLQKFDKACSRCASPRRKIRSLARLSGPRSARRSCGHFHEILSEALKSRIGHDSALLSARLMVYFRPALFRIAVATTPGPGLADRAPGISGGEAMATRHRSGLNRLQKVEAETKGNPARLPRIRLDRFATSHRRFRQPMLDQHGPRNDDRRGSAYRGGIQVAPRR
jgi:hypothetical protein